MGFSLDMGIGENKSLILFLLKILFIYLTEIETASERGNTGTGRGSGRGRSRLPAEEPDVGLDPITMGSCPEPKADAQPLCHPGAPVCLFLYHFCFNLYYFPSSGFRLHLLLFF